MSRRLLPLLALLLAGCGRVPLPADVPPSAVVGDLRYPVRADLMAVGELGVPPGWPSAGYLPLRTARAGDRSPDADFAAKLRPLVGKAILDPDADLAPPQRDDVSRLLDGYFGTPAAPAVRLPTAEQTAALKMEEVFAEGAPPGKTGADLLAEAAAGADAARADLNLTDDALARGGLLYRRWCLGCHGPTGGGDGTQAVRGTAPPRDYRRGAFKFVTCSPAGAARKGELGKARKADIVRAVRHGLDGSMMPPFPQFDDQQLDDLAGYVIHLSVRGETEFEVLNRVIRLNTNPRDDDPPYSLEFAEQVAARKLLETLANWGRAAASPIAVPPDECITELDRLRSAARGYKGFVGACGGCHADYGRTLQLKYDVWGTVVQPRNLTLGVYRGGRAGADLYARIYGGINPSTMPESKAKPPAEIWDLVHFLQVLPDPRQRAHLTQLDPTIKFD